MWARGKRIYSARPAAITAGDTAPEVEYRKVDNIPHCTEAAQPWIYLVSRGRRCPAPVPVDGIFLQGTEKFIHQRLTNFALHMQSLLSDIKKGQPAGCPFLYLLTVHLVFYPGGGTETQNTV